MQREVLGLLLSAVEPASLALSEPLLVQLTPTPGTNLEDLSSDAAFDHLKAARILSALVLEPLLEPDRAARMVMFSDRQTAALTLPEMVQAMLTATWKAPRDADARHRSLRRVTQRVALDSMMILGGSDDASPESRAYILDQLTFLAADLAKRTDEDPVTAAHYRQSARDITRYLENPKANAPRSASASWGGRPRSRFPLPPGPPLGGQ